MGVPISPSEAGDPTWAFRWGLAVLWVLAALCTGTAWGADAATLLYNEAGERYEAGQYDQAISNYEKILEMGVENGVVYYNLGNAYFKAGRLGRAIWAYERAQRWRPRDEDVQANLRFVHLLKVDQDPPSDRGFLLGFLSRLYGWFRVNELTIAVSVLYFLLMGLGMVWVVGKRTYRSLLSTLLIVCGVLFILVGTMLAFTIHARMFVQEAIVMSREVDVHSGPGEEHTTMFTIHEGTKVTIERQSGDWALIRLKHGIGGWIRAAAVERI